MADTVQLDKKKHTTPAPKRGRAGRVAVLALFGLGTFLLVAAVMIPAYAYPQLARVPANYESDTFLEAEGAQVFNSDPDVLAPETHDLSIASHTVSGDFPAAPEGVVVWANSVTIEREDGSVFQQTSELSPFDAVTGAASSYDVGFVEATEGEQQAIVRQGQIYKFPFDTQKRDYQQWDSSIGEATTATYEGEEEINGMTVYKFVQTIEPTVIETREVPGSVFGSDEASVQADMVYAMTRTLYIEPATGSPVNRVEERNQVLSHGGVQVPAFVGTVRYTEESIDDISDKLASQAPMLSGMRLTFPLVAGVVGLLCLGGGFLLRRRQRD
ncbi:DUF3068 domain-containing protein [Nocardioides sp. SYSU D00038]|uniref:DUF3068 domain-containing protein n=1 Tax=Nocardioides sp. SYSU D00038 TaxID=2812554 RepID=UPI001967D1A0|nr:DUF3068 domain-containing protein [Nocardioides sp. SYSU D00038]